MPHDAHAGRGFSRPALVAGAAALVGGLAVAAVVGERGTRPEPAAVPNPSAPAPVESLIGRVRHMYRTEGGERLIPDSTHPDGPVRLLWFEGRPARPEGEFATVTLDGGGGVIRFDERLRAQRIFLGLAGRVPASVAPAGAGRYWVADQTGGVLLAERDAGVMRMAAAPFDYPAVTADQDGGVWLARSTSLFAYRLTAAGEPLAVRLDSSGRVAGSVGAVKLPEHVLLAELGNAGHLAVRGDVVYFAPFIRDEVVALGRGGDTLWIAHRALPQAVDEPRFEIGDAGPVIDYAPVNLGIGFGPDGRLYVLSVPGHTTVEHRLDAFDPATGVLLRSARVPALPTLAVAPEGRVHLLDPFRLLTGAAPHERPAFAPFELELLGGGTMTLAALRGRVVLVNFWASWCGPCRVEMPALDSLRRSIAHPDFRFITMNEDVQAADAQDFIAEYGFDFPVLLGRGRLKQAYHYVGLPFTVLLDREGRVIQRWVGFAGEAQLAAIRGVVMAELERGGDPPQPTGHRHE